METSETAVNVAAHGEVVPGGRTQFEPGHPGYRRGAQGHKRLALTVRFVEKLAVHFETHGNRAFDEALAQNPLGYLLLVSKCIIPAAPEPEDDEQPSQITLAWEEEA